MSRLVACEDRTQPSPLSAPPSAIRSFGPNLSISQPCAGESQVCSTIRIENVIWIAGSVAPVVVWKDLVNRVQTYCGEEIAIMAIRPSRSWIQRVVETDAMAHSKRFGSAKTRKRRASRAGQRTRPGFGIIKTTGGRGLFD